MFNRVKQTCNAIHVLDPTVSSTELELLDRRPFVQLAEMVMASVYKN